MRALARMTEGALPNRAGLRFNHKQKEIARALLTHQRGRGRLSCQPKAYAAIRSPQSRRNDMSTCRAARSGSASASAGR